MTTIYELSPIARKQFFDANGNPVVGGKLFYFLNETTTKTPTYTASDGSALNTNPIILDADGRAPHAIYLNPLVTYTEVLAPAIDSDPPTSPIYTENGISLVKTPENLFLAPGTGAVNRTVNSKLSDILSVKDFGATGDGVTDNTTAINSAISANVYNKNILVPKGVYLYSSVLYTVKSDSIIGNRNFSTGYTLLELAEKSQIYLIGDSGTGVVMDEKQSYQPIGITATARGGQHVSGVRSNLLNYSTDGRGCTAFYGLAVSANPTTFWSAALHGETRHSGGTSIGMSSESASFDTSGELYGAVINNVTPVCGTHLITGSAFVEHPNATGILIQGVNSTDPSGGWVEGILIAADSMRAGGNSIRINATAAVATHLLTNPTSPATIADIHLRGNSFCGIILDGTYTSTAIRIKSGQSIAWEGTGAIRTNYNLGTGVFGIYTAETTQKFGFNLSTSSMHINGTKVVGVRDTGWADITGPRNKASTYDSSTITLGQLAERVSYLQFALTSHGLIGT